MLTCKRTQHLKSAGTKDNKYRRAYTGFINSIVKCILPSDKAEGVKLFRKSYCNNTFVDIIAKKLFKYLFNEQKEIMVLHGRGESLSKDYPNLCELVTGEVECVKMHIAGYIVP